MKIVVVSDLHLDQSTAGVDRFLDSAVVLRSAGAYAASRKADALVFNGDLCDPHTARAHRSLETLAEVVSMLHAVNIPTFLLPGNHDVIEDGSGRTVLDVFRWMDGAALRDEPGAHVFEGPYSCSRCNVIWLPFTPSSRAYDPDEFIRSLVLEERDVIPTVVFGHLNLEGIVPGSETTDMPRGRDVYWPLKALRECFPNAFLVGGHYHTPQVFEGVHVVGSGARLRFDEKDNEVGFMVLEV